MDAGDLAFLERVFQKLLLNFTWWVNRKDEQGRNIFQGGFLGLDNIGCFDRSQPLPTGGFISQADGTSWMAMYCLNLLRIALELAQHNHVYEDIATKFFEHFLTIAGAINGAGEEKLGLVGRSGPVLLRSSQSAGRRERADENPVGRRLDSAAGRGGAGSGRADDASAIRVPDGMVSATSSQAGGIDLRLEDLRHRRIASCFPCCAVTA